MSGGTLRQAGFLSKAAASNSCRKSIGLSKLSPDSTLYRRVIERRVILSSSLNLEFSDLDPNSSDNRGAEIYH